MTLPRRGWFIEFLMVVATAFALVLSLLFPWAYYAPPNLDRLVPQPPPILIGPGISAEVPLLASTAAMVASLVAPRPALLLRTIAIVLLSTVWLQESIALLDQRILGGSPLPGSRFVPAFGYWLQSSGLLLCAGLLVVAARSARRTVISRAH